MHASPFLFVIIHRGLRWSVLLRKSNYRSHLSVSVHHECIACFLRCNANRHIHNKAQRDFGTGFRRGLPIEKKYPNTDYKGCLHQVKMRQNQTFLPFSEYIDTRPSTEKVLPKTTKSSLGCFAARPQKLRSFKSFIAHKENYPCDDSGNFKSSACTDVFINFMAHRVLNSDVTKIMGFRAIFEQSVLAKNYLLIIVIPSQNIKDESLILPHI